ncbi:MAG: trypsin-like peptidase domain-containing protein [Patescibacteria group bacterium]
MIRARGILWSFTLPFLLIRWYFYSWGVLFFHLVFILYLNFFVATGDGLEIVSFASASDLTSDVIVLMTIIFLHAVTLGFFWLRVAKHIPAILQAWLYVIAATGAYFLFSQHTRPDVANVNVSTALVIESIVLFISFVTALVIYSIRYLFSKKPAALIPSKREIRALPFRFRSLLQSREILAFGLFGLIVINTAGLLFVWFRIIRIEEHLGGTRALACSERQTLANMKDSVVRILTGTGEGTGMIVRDDGVVLTNAHVVDGEPAPKVILSDYSFKTASVVMVDKDADIALLKIDGTYTTLSLAHPEGLKKLDPLLAVGYPMGTGLKGDATTTRGTYVTTRSTRRLPVSHIHFDGTINAGNSGGPGIGLAISSDDLISRVGFLADRTAALPVVEVLKLEPEKGPIETVVTFYAYIKMRNFEKAYNLVSKARLIGMPLSTWVQGCDRTLDVTLLVSTPMEEEKDTIRVKLTALDLVDEEVEETYFEGTWQVIEEDGAWRLGDSNIKKIEDPPFYWFWEG